MRRVTVSVDEETYRRARVRAAELETPVSALVLQFLKRLVPRAGWHGMRRHQLLESALDRRRRLLEAVFADFDARGAGLRMADNLPREALNDRAVTRSEAGPARLPHTDG